jgi:hypothetical protein
MTSRETFLLLVTIGTATACVRPCPNTPAASTQSSTETVSVSEPAFPVTDVQTVKVTQVNDVSFKIDKCERKNRNEVHCTGLAVSPSVDRRQPANRVKAIDNLGHEYDVESYVAGVLQGPFDTYGFLANTPATLEFVIRNVSTEATALNAVSWLTARFSGLKIDTPPVPDPGDPAFRQAPIAK